MTDSPQAADAPAPGGSPESPPKNSEAAPRNPTERMLVWGGIGLLLCIVLVELHAKQGYDSTRKALEELSQDDSREVTFDEARSTVALFPSVKKIAPEGDSNETKYQYSWFSIFKSGQYEIALRVADEGKEEVLFLGFETAVPPEEPVLNEELVEGEVPSGDHTAGMPGGGGGFGPPGGGGFGPGGGGQRPPNIVREAIDADGDDNFSAEEIEGAAAALAKLDLDSDGALSAAELRGETEAAAPAEAGGSPDAAEGEQPRRQFPNRIVVLIDKDEDGNLSAEELGNAPAALLTLDADKDGTVTREEMRPPGFGGGGRRGGGGGPGPGAHTPDAGGRPQRPPVEAGGEAPEPLGASTPAAETTEAAKDATE
ncbi:MAG: hypothetical protein KDA88_11090 [Planctomycetaceae bacterium]|nr:hypothetical protein [Planctomycetaceae bacterium]